MNIIEEITPINPWSLAESVVLEVRAIAAKNNIQTNIDRVGADTDLAEYAHSVYIASDGFRKKINSSNGRDYLHMFMQHWISVWLKNHEPSLFNALPPTFHTGKELI